jgi:type II secretory pathway pseudopilin PulG
MTLLEVVITLATILVLISALLGVGSYIKTRANIDLTESMLEVLSTALEQYYQDQVPNAFPFAADLTYAKADLEGAVNGLNGNISSGTLLDEYASSAALFYFLNQTPSSRAIASAVSDTLITNKDAFGNDITFTFTLSGTTIDLPRYIDPWGTSIRYEYLPGTAFPTLTSAGPDRVFGTPDDITSK